MYKAFDVVGGPRVDIKRQASFLVSKPVDVREIGTGDLAAGCARRRFHRSLVVQGFADSILVVSCMSDGPEPRFITPCRLPQHVLG